MANFFAEHTVLLGGKHERDKVYERDVGHVHHGCTEDAMVDSTFHILKAKRVTPTGQGGGGRIFTRTTQVEECNHGHVCHGQLKDVTRQSSGFMDIP